MTMPADMTKDEERALQLLLIALDLLGIPEGERAGHLGVMLHMGRMARGVA